MFRIIRACFGFFLLQILLAVFPASAQSPAAGSTPLREVHADGAKILTRSANRLSDRTPTGSQVGKDDLQTRQTVL